METEALISDGGFGLSVPVLPLTETVVETGCL